MSSDQDNSNFSKSIPSLDSSNFNEWLVRIQLYLKHKGLLKYCLEPYNSSLSGAAETTVNAKRTEAALILISHISSEAFDAVIDIDNSEDPHHIWTNILNRYASQSFNNKARVWLKFMRMEWNGDLKLFIQDCRKILNEVALVKLGVPANVLCYSILAKLPRQMWNIVDTLVLNEALVSVPEATLSKLQEFVYAEETRKKEPTKEIVKEESASALYQNSNQPKSRRNFKRNVHYCSDGKHNPLSNHSEDKCFQLHPELKANFNRQSHSVETNEPAFHTASVISPTCLNSEIMTKAMVLDSGATHHMLNQEKYFISLAPTNLKISTGNNHNLLEAKAIGSAQLVNDQGKKILLQDVLFVPNLNRNLLSLPRLFKHTISISKKGNNRAVVDIDDVFKLLVQTDNNLLELENSSLFAINSGSSYFSRASEVDWHCRLGHPHHSYLVKMFPDSKERDCEICTLSKMRHQPFKSHFKPVSAVLEAVHMDVVGPFPIQSISGASYFLTIVDQFSGYKIIKFLKHKSDVMSKIRLFKAEAEKQTQKSLKLIISDGGGEFNNQELTEFCSEHGIIHHFSPPYTPQNNGMAERANKSIIEKARCLLTQSKLSPKYWAEAINTSTDLCNLLPSRSRNFQIPYEVWHGKKFKYDTLKPFGCLVYYLKYEHSRLNKLDTTGEKGIFLGYLNDFSNFKIMNSSGGITSTREVKFREDQFPGGNRLELQSEIDPFEIKIQDTPPTQSSDDHSQNQNVPESTTQENHEVINEEITPSHEISSAISPQNILNYDRRGNIINVNLAESYFSEPKYYHQAINSSESEKWNDAISKELENMKNHDVWEVVEKKPEDKLLNCTWVFKVKKDSENEATEYKARLCVQGFKQTEGLDYFTTFAPTGKLTSLRILMSFALDHNLKFHQIDIKSAFLNAPLSETILLKPPPGVSLDKNKVLKLKKAMYGLKQAPQAWHQTFTQWLFSIGFHRCDAEPCVFWRKGTFLYLHVDDVAIFSQDPEVFKQQAQSKFRIKDLGPANFLLGMKIIQEANSYRISQAHYIENLLNRFNFTNLTPSRTPLNPRLSLTKASPSEVQQFERLKINYRTLIGALNYLSTTSRPDITYAVSSLSQYSNQPGITHYEAAVQVFRYLKYTKDFSLKINKNTCQENILKAYTDADWGNCEDSRKSITGFLVLFNNNLVSWKSKKQPTISLSTTEAEYKAIGDAVKEIMWIKIILKNIFQIKFTIPTPIYEDNQGAIELANNESNHNNFKTKHMNIRHHFIRNEIKIKKIELVHVRSADNLADFLTKPVGKTSITRARNNFNI